MHGMSGKVLAVGLAAFAIAAPAAATVVVGSSLAMEATARVRQHGVTDRDSAVQGASLAPLTVSVFARAEDGASSVETGGTAQATWLSASAGQVLFDDVGWRASDVPGGAANPAGGAGWSYSFIADTDGLFEMDWEVTIASLTSDAFGLNPFLFTWSGDGGGIALAGAGQSGTLMRPIEEGVAYTVGLRSQANVGGALRSRSAQMDARFDWQMDTAATVLPEPGTLALFGLAFLGLGAGARRARRN